MIETIKKISLKYTDEKMNELKDQFIEMGQLKSDFDMEKFTVMSKGRFPAHQFHMLMRQYHLALHESRRMLLDKEEKTRLLQKLNVKEDEYPDIDGNIKFKDIEIKRLVNEIDMLEITMTNKLCMCDYFEKLRLKLIEKNDSKPFTNEDHQKEEPEYWKWFVENKMKMQLIQGKSNVNEGLLEVINQLEDDSVINEKYKVDVHKHYGFQAIPLSPEEVKRQMELQRQQQQQRIIQPNIKPMMRPPNIK